MKHLISFWKSLVSAFVILVLSVMDTGENPAADFTYFDKIEHFGTYMFFTILIIYDLKKSGVAGSSQNVIFLTAVSAASVYGGGMEILQMIPELHRTAEFADFCANTAGSSVAAMFFPQAESVIRTILKK